MSGERQKRVLPVSVEAWLDAFVSPEGPAWMGELRVAAAALVRELGLPAHTDESWRLTPVDQFTTIPFEVPPRDWRPREEPAWLEESLPRWSGEHRVTFVDGRLVHGSAPDGMEVLSMEQAWRECPELLEPHLGRVASARRDQALGWRHLNTALFADGVVVRLREGVATREPVHVVLASDRHGGPTVLHPRMLVLAEPGSEGTVVETWIGPKGSTYLVNQVTEVVVGPGAVLEHVRVQQEGNQAFHLGTLAVSQGRDSRYTSRVISAGGHLARLDLEVALTAPGAECQLDGVYVAGADMHQAHHTTIEHQQPHTTSRERYKGILTGRSRAVFDGRIKVLRDAQKTVAHQENRNLLLSGDALVFTKPSLEIDADDVKCGHGATVGQLDPEALFYLRSRGIEERAARGVLTAAFAQEMLDGIEVEPLRRRLTRTILRQIPECGVQGEL